jgi:hypothetical protein
VSRRLEVWTKADALLGQIAITALSSLAKQAQQDSAKTGSADNELVLLYNTHKKLFDIR